MTTDETTTVQSPVSKQPEKPATETERERELLEAVARIYRKYGADLSAFRRDLENEIAKKDSRSAA